MTPTQNNKGKKKEVLKSIPTKIEGNDNKQLIVTTI